MAVEIISDIHFHTVLTYIYHKQEELKLNYYNLVCVEFKDLEKIGNLFVELNHKAYRERYYFDSIGGLDKTIPFYKFQYQGSNAIKNITPLQFIKLLDGIEYHCCDSDDYLKSEAKYIIDSVRKAVVGSLPEYDDAPLLIYG